MKKYLLSAIICVGASAAAADVIDNGTIQLGVDNFGQLNTDGVGLTDMRTGWESTYPGCLCEGWGAGFADAGGAGVDWGGANNALGVFNLTLVSFTATVNSATSVADVGASLRVTHTFSPAPETDDLYRVSVTIQNISGAIIPDLRYRRVMDWDVEPTAFSEYVTIQGTGAASAVLFASDNGFASVDPFSGSSNILSTGDFVDSGPDDHGALFDFGFGSLGIGEIYDFEIFYGASLSEDAALLALGAVGAEVYSFGQASDDVNGGTADRSTFIFGFTGVGGVPVSPVPVPGSALMLIGGLGLLGSLRLRRRQDA